MVTVTLCRFDAICDVVMSERWRCHTPQARYDALTFTRTARLFTFVKRAPPPQAAHVIELLRGRRCIIIRVRQARQSVNRLRRAVIVMRREVMRGDVVVGSVATKRGGRR